MKYFGCCVWYHLPDEHNAKFNSNSCKSISLGFLPDMTKNIYYYHEDSDCIKKVSHFCFDECFNDIPLEQQPPRIIALCNSCDGKPFLIDHPSYSTSEDFYFFDTPFNHTDTYTLNAKCDDSTFGILLVEDEVNHHAYVLDTSKSKKSSVDLHF